MIRSGFLLLLIALTGCTSRPVNWDNIELHPYEQPGFYKRQIYRKYMGNEYPRGMR